MYNETHKLVSDMDIVIMAAAVADYKPENISENKIKSAFNDESIYVFSNPDLLRTFLVEQEYLNSNLLFMSSGNYASLDLEEIKDLVKTN